MPDRLRFLRGCFIASLLLFTGFANVTYGKDGDGEATISPTIAEIDSLGTWVLTYKPGSDGIAINGGMKVRFSGFTSRVFTTPQCDNPESQNYTTASSTNPNAKLDIKIEKELKGGWMLYEEVTITVKNAPLAENDTIKVVYGDTSKNGPGGKLGWNREGYGLRIPVLSDTNGDGKFAELSKFPKIDVLGKEATALRVFAPSTVIAGKSFEISVTALDSRNNVASRSGPKVMISCSDPSAVFVPELNFDAAKEKAVTKHDFVLNAPGVHTITVRAKSESELRTIEAKDFISSSTPENNFDPDFKPALEKVEISADEAKPGSTIMVRTYWRNGGSKSAAENYRIFCHIEKRPEGGKALTNWDHNPSTTTTSWNPGNIIVDEFVGNVDAKIQEGEHMLTAGIYYLKSPGEFINFSSYEICRLKIFNTAPLRKAPASPVTSNPIKVVKGKPEFFLLWGDLHCHTEISGDAAGSLEGLYWYARDVLRHDFCASSDHVGANFPKDKWALVQDAAKSFYEPGRFASILGYEWSNAHHGDKNVYFTKDNEDVYVPASGQAEDLYKHFEGRNDLIIIPHHPAYPVGLRGTDWTRIDTNLMYVVEMASDHGAGEYFGNPNPYGGNKFQGPSLPGGFAQDALNRGLRIGFICSSDDHSGMTGKDKFLAAVYSRDITREGIIEALRKRRCYGAKGARIIVDFRINGKIMGEELRAEPPLSITGEVQGATAIKKVEVVKDGKVIFETPGKGTSLLFEYSDRNLDRACSYYYLRVTQADGSMAWSSPIWVDSIIPLPDLAVIEISTSPAWPETGKKTTITASIKNIGDATSSSAKVIFLDTGAVSTPVNSEREPVGGGIGGLMSNKRGFQVWRWKVDEQSINVFLRWGDSKTAHNFKGTVEVIDADTYIFTPFHDEKNDKYDDNGRGGIGWDTDAEPGAGDGLNIWVKINPRKRTRLKIDVLRNGERFPEEVYTRIGKIEQLPFELDLVEYHPERFMGEIDIPALKPAGSKTARVEWTPMDPGAHNIIVKIEPAQPEKDRQKENNRAENSITVNK